MPKNYTLRRYCQDEDAFKYEEQIDVTFNPNFIPQGCETHTLDEPVIVDEEEI